MTHREHQFLLAEKGTIERLLDEIPEEQIIDRLGLESRKEEIETLLAAQPVPYRKPVQASLTLPKFNTPSEAPLFFLDLRQ